MIYWIIFGISSPKFSSMESQWKSPSSIFKTLLNLFFPSIFFNLLNNLLWETDWVVLQDIEKPHKKKQILIFRFLRQINKNML